VGQNIVFRFAERGDCALILRFINDLAEFEHLSDEVVAGEESLAYWLFEKKAAEVIFAVIDGREAGFALFFTNFSTFLGRAGMYLEDLYVLPDFRRRGVATYILRELARIAVERGYGRFEWACLDWNTPGIELYRSFGAAPMSGWTTYRLSGDALAGFAMSEIPVKRS
jgi:GNAT superfamily N-acetyltransferase